MSHMTVDQYIRDLPKLINNGYRHGGRGKFQPAPIEELRNLTYQRICEDIDKDCSACAFFDITRRHIDQMLKVVPMFYERPMNSIRAEEI